MSELDAVRQQAVALENVINACGVRGKSTNILFHKSIFFPLEPPETFGFGDGTRAALVDMSCARVGSRQNGVAR